jgi:hypothetical protein
MSIPTETLHDLIRRGARERMAELKAELERLAALLATEAGHINGRRRRLAPAAPAKKRKRKGWSAKARAAQAARMKRRWVVRKSREKLVRALKAGRKAAAKKQARAKQAAGGAADVAATT